MFKLSEVAKMEDDLNHIVKAHHCSKCNARLEVHAVRYKPPFFARYHCETVGCENYYKEIIFDIGRKKCTPKHRRGSKT